jgi:hypothetical protein
VAAERARQERDFPWERTTDDPRRTGQVPRDRDSHTPERRSPRQEPSEDAALRVPLPAGLPGLPQLFREAAQAIKSAEGRVLAVEDQMREVIAAAEQRIRAAEARAKAAEELAQSLEKRAAEAVKAAERRAEAAEATARSAEEWVTRVRRALNEPG